MKNFILYSKILVLLSVGIVSAQEKPSKELIGDFVSRTGASLSIQKSTGAPGFIRMPGDRPLFLEGTGGPEKSLNFLKENPEIFGIQADRDEFNVKSSVRDNIGMEHVTLQQYYRGVPIFDGVMKFHFDARSNLRTVNGNFIGGIKVDPVPSVPAEEAGRFAVREVSARKERDSGSLKIVSNTLYIFQKGLVQGYRGAHHLVYEVQVSNESDIREFVYVDAHTGFLVEQFSGIHGALTRRLYNQTYNPSAPETNLLWKEGDEFPGALNDNTWQQSSVQSAGHIYHLFKNAFGFISFNGADGTMISTHNNPSIACPNANWNGISANYCDQTASDDVVAHEWAHAYTEYTSNLIYGWQSGALNESFSDMWGETVDILNNYMDEGEDVNTTRTACGSSSRWQIGEKATAFGGAIRDMWNPGCFGDPGRVKDPVYHCFDFDGGGVHINSGVPNHAYALLADGGSYNGQNINGIGLTKAAHIMWRVQSQYLSRTSNFITFGEAMLAAGNDLIGASLQSLTVAPDAPSTSGEVITAGDIAELNKVILATELLEENNCGFPPLFEAAGPLCEGAGADLAIFYEDFEDGFTGWTISNQPAQSSSWIERNWEIRENAEGRTGKAAFAVSPSLGDCSTATSQSGILRLESPDITIPPATEGPFRLAFDHLFSLEDSWDAGNLKYSSDNGQTWILIPEPAFILNGYNRTAQSGNPLAGQKAFSAGSQGDVKSNWGTSIVDLSALGLLPSGTIRLRWELGTDICEGYQGWYIDDVRVYSCAVTPAVHFAESASFVTEAEGAGEDCLGYIEKELTVQIDQAPSQPVVVTLSADPSSEASYGENADFSFSPASVTLDAGNLTGHFTVRIYNDAYVETPETILFNYTIDPNGGNGYAGNERQEHIMTITDNDLPPGNSTNTLLDATFNSGREGWVVRNGGSDPNSWIYTQYSGSTYLDAGGRPLFIVIGYNNTYSFTSDEILESPSFSSAGQKNLQLSFLHYFLTYSGGSNETGTVEVWDGQAWQVLKTYCQSGCGDGAGTQGTWSNPAAVVLDIPDEYANAQMKVRFRYQAFNDNYWAIDNVRVSSSHSTTIQSSANAGNGDTQYLGPNETAVFYDPLTGRLMASIENLTGHDYGCTTVEIDRAGADETPWFGSYKITNKTFKVTPEHNNEAGSYKITLYYKADELPTFTGDKIKSMGKSSGGIASGNSGASSWAEVSSESAFDGDYAFTATFDSGFSGFGLSDAPPIGSLPVRLAEIDGLHTAEGNLIRWSTASEDHNDYFVVERSRDASLFEGIGQVKSAGNGSALRRYSFLDTGSGEGLRYYRLKQVDQDGTHSYSEMIAIASGGPAGDLKYGPNPVLNILKIKIPGEDTQTVSFRVIDQAGRPVISPGELRTQNGVLEYDLGNLQPGVYQVIILNAAVKYIVPVVKL